MTTRPIDLVLDRLEAVRRSGDSGHQWTACCPAHDDSHQSLSVGVTKEGVVLLKCHTGCQTADILASLGLTFADLRTESARLDILPFSKRTTKTIKKAEPPQSPKYFQKLLADCERDPDCRRGVERFAKQLGLPFQALWDLGCRWKRIEIYPRNPLDPGELWYPERDGSGEIIGIGIRSWDGSKCFVSGGRRGLIYTKDILKKTGPVYLVEGLTDVAALLSIGACVIGRPSNQGGTAFLALLLARVARRGHSIIVIADNDLKADGSWPGREGAEKTARPLAELIQAPVQAALLPPSCKDSREWYQSSTVASSTNLAVTYRQSLTVFATYPLQSPPVTEEEIKSALIPMPAAGGYAYPDELCPRPGHMLLRHLETHLLRHVLNRCGSSSCPQCLKRRKRLRHESLCRHFEAVKDSGGTLYESKQILTLKEWATIRRGIKRRGGNFVYFRHAGEVAVIIATVPFVHSHVLPFEKASEFTKQAIAEAIILGRGKPFYSASDAWAMEREKKERQYEKIGNCKHPPQMVKKICIEELGKENYKQKRPEDSPVLIDGYINYATHDPDNDAFVQKLLGNLPLSESTHTSMGHSDIFPPADYGVRCLPSWWDDVFAWWRNPTG